MGRISSSDAQPGNGKNFPTVSAKFAPYSWRTRRHGACTGRLLEVTMRKSARAQGTNRISLFFIVGAAAAIAAFSQIGCGGAGGNIGPAGIRESGQSRMMDKTFAGANVCNPKNHARPFVIEWDATDMSSFEARASKDVVVVQYEGCELRVLEGCRPSTPGNFGTYRSPDWTAGSLESIDVSNQGELYAKLPLGVASLGGRVEAGEQFKMEYYVSGTTSATREELTRAEIANVAACKGATHFVYGYNLGAFALGSKSEIKGEVGGSAWGFGAGGSTRNSAKADKKGGDLSVCKGESMREVSGCKTPVRLTLRELSDAQDPAAAARNLVDTPSAKSLAGKLKADTDKEKAALVHFTDANRKMSARDGKGCLSDLDKHDKLDPRPDGLSSNPKAQIAGIRAQCIMLSGQCDAGKVLMRKVQEMYMSSYGDEVIDRMVESIAKDKCQGGKRSPRDELLYAWNQLQVSAQTNADCAAADATVKRLRPVVKPTDESDTTITSMEFSYNDMLATCYIRAKDCPKAWEAFEKIEEATQRKRFDEQPHFPGQAPYKSYVRTIFEGRFKKCKGR